MNRWHIPEWLEVEVIDRDRRCIYIYCGVEFVPDPASRRHRPTWEHIVNDARIVTRENIARCCVSCNASKGGKNLAVWLQSRYCRARGITAQTIATVARAALTAD
jgi:hypothetical protein